MHANLASIMPQVVGVWCEAEGHQVTLVCYTGLENLVEELPGDVDIVFIGAFTEAALLAYALSNLFRSRGAVTVLGGPHARCYPEDARKYFDYVVGFADRALIREILRDCSPHPPPGRIDFIAESSLSLLSEAHLKRMAHSGFKALLPGVESWYDLGNKSKTGENRGMDKVRQVSDHVNTILRYIPYVQTNFVLGLD